VEMGTRKTGHFHVSTLSARFVESVCVAAPAGSRLFGGTTDARNRGGNDMTMSDQNQIETLTEKIRQGETISAEQTRTVFKTADAAGMLYYKMLTMVRERRSLSELPATLKEIIKTKAWQRWRWVGSTFSQNSLGGYLTSLPPNGVGIELDTVKKLIADDPEAEVAFRDEMVGDQGAHVPHGYNIPMRNRRPARGTSRAYLLDRLKRERPDLFNAVKTKRLSANAAAIEAGFRRKATPFEQVLKLLPKLTDAERDQVRQLLD
jgi:hypothetical protein